MSGGGAGVEDEAAAVVDGFATSAGGSGSAVEASAVTTASSGLAVLLSVCPSRFALARWNAAEMVPREPSLLIACRAGALPLVDGGLFLAAAVGGIFSFFALFVSAAAGVEPRARGPAVT